MQEIKKEILQNLIAQMKAMMAEGEGEKEVVPAEMLDDCAEGEVEEEESSVMEEMFPKKKPTSPSKPNLPMSAVKQLLMKKPEAVKEVIKVSVTPKFQYKK